MQKLSRDQATPEQSVKTQNFSNHPMVLQPQMTQVQPSNCLLLSNMFDPSHADLRKDPTFFLDIKEQVEDVCKELGRLEKVWVEQNSPGNVWVKFAKTDIEAAVACLNTLNQRFFDQRLITASFVPENVFNSKVKER
jgi:hypothetical protein